LGNQVFHIIFFTKQTKPFLNVFIPFQEINMLF
jgi:hypothetical protein